MANHHLSEDYVGIFSGLIGYVLSKSIAVLKVVLFIPILDLFPSFVEIAHSIIMAVLCAIAGFITTRICHFIWVSIKERRNEKNSKKL